MVRVLVWGPIFCMATHGCGGKASDNSRATDTPTGGAAQADDDDESPPPPVPLPGAVELCTQWVDAGTCSVRWEDCLRLHGEGSGCDEEVIASIDCLLRGNWDCSKGFLVRLGCDEELDLWDQCLGN